MKCPKCQGSKQKVLDTRKFDTVIRRVRECLEDDNGEQCGHIWITWEMNHTAITVKIVDSAQKFLNTAI